MLPGNYCYIKVKGGSLKVYYSEKGLISCSFPAKTSGFGPKKVPVYIERLAEDLKQYFSGKKVSFTCQLDFQGSSAFEIAVWKKTRQIPYGKTISYSALAKKLGRPKAARAVGNALGKNLVPIIVPCHRVVKSDGSLGGFSGGISWKSRLLNMEKASDKRSPLWGTKQATPCGDATRNKIHT